jgi:hypothetical protein
MFGVTVEDYTGHIQNTGKLLFSLGTTFSVNLRKMLIKRAAKCNTETLMSSEGQ